MSAADLATPRALAPRFRLNWIAGPWTDLPWFIGGALGGYALFAMYAVLDWPMDTIWLVWYVLLDIPHFFGTYVRTYMDPVERARRPVLLYGSLFFPLVGPTALLIGYAMFRWGSPEVARLHMLPFDAVFVFLMLWAYWHVVRQHYGIMALYKRKNADVSPSDRWIDNGLLYSGLLVPLLTILLRHPHARAELPLPATPGFMEEFILSAGTWLVMACAVLFAWRQFSLALRGEPINVPKLLFLLAVVPLHLFVGWHPATLATTLLGFVAFVTIFHDIQYHAIVWHAQRVKLTRPGVDPARHGLSAWVSSHIAIFMGCAVLMGAGAWYIGCSLGIRPGCFPLIQPGEYPLFGNVTLFHLLAGTVFGFIMHHYFVDGFIWKPSKDETVRRELVEGSGR